MIWKACWAPVGINKSPPQKKTKKKKQKQKKNTKKQQNMNPYVVGKYFEEITFKQIFFRF